MKAPIILYICLLISINASTQDSKWTMSISTALANEDQGYGRWYDNWVQTSFSVEAGYDLSKWLRLGAKHLLARDRSPYEEPIFFDLSGGFLQIGYNVPTNKFDAYLEVGYYHKNHAISELLIDANRLSNLDNRHYYSWGIGFAYSFFSPVHIGLGLNHYTPFARRQNINIPMLIAPKLELTYRF